MQLQFKKLAMAEDEYTNQDQAGDINEKLLLDLAWERQQKKVRVLIAREGAAAARYLLQTPVCFKGRR